PAERVRRVDLVDHDLERQLLCAVLAQHRGDGARLLVETVFRHRGVDDVQDQIRDEGLLERRREAFDELRRESADETDCVGDEVLPAVVVEGDRKSTRLNSSHSQISYAVFCLKKKKSK